MTSDKAYSTEGRLDALSDKRIIPAAVRLSSAPQLVNSLSWADIGGVTLDVPTGPFLVEGQVYYTVDQAQGSAKLRWQFTGTVGTVRIACVEFTIGANPGAAGGFGNTGPVTAFTANWQSSAFGTDDRAVWFAGVLDQVTGAGTLKMQAACTTAAYTWQIRTGTYMKITAAG